MTIKMKNVTSKNNGGDGIRIVGQGDTILENVLLEENKGHGFNAIDVTLLKQGVPSLSTVPDDDLERIFLNRPKDQRRWLGYFTGKLEKFLDGAAAEAGEKLVAFLCTSAAAASS